MREQILTDRNEPQNAAAQPASAPAAEPSVELISACDLAVRETGWEFAAANAAAIDVNWQAALKRNPGYFNGRVFVLRQGALSARRFTGTVTGVDFKSFLYWRDQGFPETGIRDVFGSALIRSAEGHVLLGRQRAGHINAGRIYPPGGFIDVRDIRADGTIDIHGSTARELAEETGLDPTTFDVRPGIWLTRLGPHISLAIEFRSPLNSEALLAEAVKRLGTVEDELTEFVVIRSAADLTADVLPVARALVRAVFAACPA